MKKYRNRIWAVLLSAAMLTGLAACGSAGDEKEETPEFVYVSEFVDLPISEGENESVNVMQMTADTLYYRLYSWDEEKGESSVALYSLALGESGAAPVKLPVQLDEARNIMQMKFDAEGNLYAAMAAYEEIEETDEYGDTYTTYDYDNAKYFLKKYGPDGTEVFSEDITESMQSTDRWGSYIQNMEIDQEGNLYVSDQDSWIQVFDSAGKKLFQLELSNWIRGMGVAGDGCVYISMWGNAGENVLRKVDVASKDFGPELTGLPGNMQDGISRGIKKDILLRSDSKLYEYDIETQSSEEVLKFIDCDLNTDYIENFVPTEDGRLMIYYRDWGTGDENIVYVTQKPYAEVPEKEVLTLGALSIDQNTRAAVIKFNKSSEKYRITVRDYSESIGGGNENDYQSSYQDAVTRLNNDILTGNAPDLIGLTAVNIKLMAQQGVFEDLGQYLDGSGKLKRADLVQSVLQAYTINDTLCAIPTSFSISTLLSAASLVGDEMGWTVDEMLAVVDKMPEDAMIMEYPSKSRVLQYMLLYGADDYVDWTEGKCHFDSPEFIKILEFANRFPTEYNGGEDAPVMPELVEAGKLLLVDQHISQLSDYQIIRTIWGEPITCIGYPTAGSNGSMISGNSPIAISSKSKNKEAAWEFLEGFIVDTASSDRYSRGFSVLESKLKEQFEREMEADYATDENGEFLYDENGKKVEISHGGWSFGNGVSYDIYSCSQEEADAVRKLIDNTTTLVSQDTQIMNIINEEVAPYFDGQKSVQEVADIIQNRIQTYVDEIR